MFIKNPPNVVVQGWGSGVDQESGGETARDETRKDSGFVS